MDRRRDREPESAFRCVRGGGAKGEGKTRGGCVSLKKDEGTEGTKRE